MRARHKGECLWEMGILACTCVRVCACVFVCMCVWGGSSTIAYLCVIVKKERKCDTMKARESQSRHL